MTDEQAETYIKGRADVENAVNRLRLRYTPIFRRVLSARTTALFFQLDWRLGLMVDLQLKDWKDCWKDWVSLNLVISFSAGIWLQPSGAAGDAWCRRRIIHQVQAVPAHPPRIPRESHQERELCANLSPPQKMRCAIFSSCESGLVLLQVGNESEAAFFECHSKVLNIQA